MKYLTLFFLVCCSPFNRDQEKSITPSQSTSAPKSVENQETVPEKNENSPTDNSSVKEIESSPSRKENTKDREEEKKIEQIQTPQTSQSTKSIENTDPSSWRGVNLPLIGDEGKGKDLSQSDFDYAVAAGANVIRLTVHADPRDNRPLAFTKSDGSVINSAQSPGMIALRKAVNMAAKAKIKIIIDMHTFPGREDALIWENVAYWQTLKNLWQLIASEYSNDNTVVGYDLMNEPNIINALGQNKGKSTKKMFEGTWSPDKSWKGTAKDYTLQIKTISNAIRSVDNDHFIIVEGFGILGSPTNFYWMTPLEGISKVVYSFHMYAPTGLTNIGAKGFKSKGKEGKNYNKKELEEKIEEALAPVIAFQRKYNVPIFVGEFGVTNDAIFSKDDFGKTYNGACWMSVLLKRMNKTNWGWAFWDFWTESRRPKSKQDPRYVILSAAMNRQTIPDYCNQ